MTFWADALRSGDTTFALLAQSFFFSPQEMEQSRFSDRDFAVAMCYAILNRQPHTDEPDSWAGAIAENGRIQLFKAFYSTHEIPEVYGSFGITIGTEDSDRYPLDRTQLAAEAEANAAVRESQSVATGAGAACYTPGDIPAHARGRGGPPRPPAENASAPPRPRTPSATRRGISWPTRPTRCGCWSTR